MAFIRRMFFFVLTNIAIVVLGTIIFAIIQKVFGINLGGGSYLGLAIWALLYGFFASFVSLLLSRWMAKRSHGIQLISPDILMGGASPEKIVYQTVQNIALQHGITIPEVGVYESSEVNAFATGATKNSSLVAVSRGLLDTMSPSEIEGVVAHEMAHILNGDMVTMTLLQGVINAFVIFLSRAIAQIVGRGENGNGLIYYAVVIVLEIGLGLIGSIIVMAYSRRREYAADAGSASYVGKNKMIDALKALQRIHTQNISGSHDAQTAALKIDGKSHGFMHLFASHPPLELRIKHLTESV